MTILRWAETDRDLLNETLPEAVVLLPMGATEQHGPFLPTGTDHLLADWVARRAAAQAEASAERTFVIAPTLPIGASDHHLPYGGTLSVSAQTLLTVLTDVLQSMAVCGARRVVLINGHGGNTGICHAAAAAASSVNQRSGGTGPEVAVAHLDYWTMLPAEDSTIDRPLVPGHAGMFETSMILAMDPALVRVRSAQRPDVEGVSAPEGVTVHAAAHWAAMDGYSDHPEAGTEDVGARLAAEIITALSGKLAELTRSL